MKIPVEVSVHENCRQGITHTATLMTRHLIKDSNCNDGDIVILASDDFTCEKGWDEHVRNQFSFSWDGVLIVRDGYKFDVNIVPIPVLSAKCLRRLGGVIYSPHYFHFYSDEELYYIAMELGIVKNLRNTDAPLFAHKHWSFNGARQKDKFDERNNTKWNEDKATYDRRKTLSVEEKLKLPDWWQE